MAITTTLYILLWDSWLTAVNLVTPKVKKGKPIVQDSALTAQPGKWPEFHPPVEGDSRGSCPALNALCNHGILPRDGKNITFVELSKKVHEVYNFAESFCLFVPDYSAAMLGRKYATDTFDLAELDIRNGVGGKGIEHDGSLVREDLVWQPDQSVIAQDLIKELLDSASGVVKGQEAKVLTKKDVSRMLSIRRADYRQRNPEFKELSAFHRFFGSSKFVARPFITNVSHICPLALQLYYSFLVVTLRI